mmetsp:Transcript_45589/g.58515  ORF Transcript_45589/g.58515 Transcript_45589/m.58515 type:complete len:274 (-) Transcript_45589:810-1631(-)
MRYQNFSNFTADGRNRRGFGKIPVAAYKFTYTQSNKTDIDAIHRFNNTSNNKKGHSINLNSPTTTSTSATTRETTKSNDIKSTKDGNNTSRREGATATSVYTFCMCPGGQIVPTSIEKEKVCINGMSFSKRNSRWANSGIVVSIEPQHCFDEIKDDSLSVLKPSSPALIGLYFQEYIESKAAVMGGGNLSIPVQRVSDFLIGRELPKNESIPKSSYQLGVTPARLDLLFPPKMTQALREGLYDIEKKMPGFITCSSALLHGVSKPRRTHSAHV